MFFYFWINAKDCHVTMIWNILYKYTGANVTWEEFRSIVIFNACIFYHCMIISLILPFSFPKKIEIHQFPRGNASLISKMLAYVFNEFL